MSRKHRRKMKQQAAPPKPSAGGRETALTPDVQAVIVEASRKGLPITFAGPRVGLHESTVRNWMRWGKAGKSPLYVAFFTAVKQAQAEYVLSCVSEIKHHGATSWQALAWLLERMHRDEFGGDKLELNQLKKELKELRQLLVKVPRDAGEDAAETGGQDEGGGDGPADGPAPPA
jgi:hypothetical protein